MLRRENLSNSGPAKTLALHGELCGLSLSIGKTFAEMGDIEPKSKTVLDFRTLNENDFSTEETKELLLASHSVPFHSPLMAKYALQALSGLPKLSTEPDDIFMPLYISIASPLSFGERSAPVRQIWQSPSTSMLGPISVSSKTG